jgi:hypothetical protein
VVVLLVPLPPPLPKRHNFPFGPQVFLIKKRGRRRKKREKKEERWVETNDVVLHFLLFPLLLLCSLLFCSFLPSVLRFLQE